MSRYCWTRFDIRLDFAILSFIFFVFKDRCQRHNILPVAYLNMSLPRIDGTTTLMTLGQLKEMFFAVRIKQSFVHFLIRIFSLVVFFKFF